MSSADDLRTWMAEGLSGVYATASWPTYDGKTLHRGSFLTSSEAMNCDMRLYFDKVDDQEPPTAANTVPAGTLQQPVSSGVMLRGQVVEAALVDALRFRLPEGYELLYAGSDQRSFYNEHLLLSGTPDGALCWSRTALIPLEFKSHDPRASVTLKPNHAIQLQQNAGLMRLCLKAPIASLGYVIYTNCNDYYQEVFTVDTSPKVTDKILETNSAKAKKLFEAIDAKDPMRLPATGTNTGECKFCPHVSKCPAKNAGKIPGAAAAGASAFQNLTATKITKQGPGAARMAAKASLSSAATAVATPTDPDPRSLLKKQLIASLYSMGANDPLLQKVLQANNFMQQPLQGKKATMAIIDEPVKMGVSDIVDEYIKVDTDIKQLELDKKEFKEDLLRLFADTGKSELSGRLGTVTKITVDGRESFDYKAFLKDNELSEEQVAPYRKKGAASVRLDVKRKE